MNENELKISKLSSAKDVKINLNYEEVHAQLSSHAMSHTHIPVC